MKRLLLILAAGAAAQAHDVITTSITWDREISRLVFTHCASCHHPDGMAFSLMTYKDARPWAEAIKEEVLARRMPPWGAVKGFGDFRNDQALTPEEMEIVTSWADGGVPEGEDKDLGPAPKLAEAAPGALAKGDLAVNGDLTLTQPFTLDGLWPQTVPEKGSFQITATLPDGSIQPLLWLEQYKPAFGHPFLFRTPLELPKGTIISGIPAGGKIVLMKPVPQPTPETAAKAGQ